jgi:hypothetical protein
MGGPEQFGCRVRDDHWAIEDPAHMPVTRDLSTRRRAVIQVWIKNECPEGGSDA